MSNNFWDEKVIRAVMDCESNQLKDLISITGYSSADFLKYADLRRVDLRNQDLIGVDLSFAQFEGAVVDQTTKFDEGLVPIVDREEFVERVMLAISGAEPYFNIKQLTYDFTRVLSRSARAVVVTGGRIRMQDLFRDILGHPGNVGIFSVSRGFIQKNAVLYGASAASDSVIEDAMDEISKAFSISSSAKVIQPELPFSDGLPKSVNPSVPSRSLARRFSNLSSGLRKYKSISSIWVGINEDYYNFSRDAGSIIKETSSLKLILFGSLKGYKDVLDKINFRSGEIDIFDTNRYYHDSNFYYFSYVENYVGKRVRFSTGFKREAEKFGQWPEIAPLVGKICRAAVCRTSFYPVKIGVDDLRREASIP